MCNQARRRGRAASPLVSRAVGLVGDVSLLVSGLGCLLGCLLAGGARAQTPEELDAALGEIDRLTTTAEVAAAVARAEELLEQVGRRYGPESPEAARVLAAAGLAHCVGRHEIDVGFELSTRAVELASRTAGADPRPSLRALAWCQQQRGSYHDARATLLRALSGSGTLAGSAPTAGEAGSSGADVSSPTFLPGPPRDGLDARLRVELGVNEHYLGNPSAARELLERALREAEAASPPMAEVARGSRNALGVVTWQLGDLEAAAEHFERLLEDALVRLGPDHRNTAIYSNNLGLVLQDLGRWIEARRHYERAVSSARARGDLSEGNALNNLGNLAQDLGDWSAGEDAYRSALEIYEQTVGPEHPHVARTLTNFGNLLRVTGRLDEAERRYRRALEIRERALGADHLDVAYTVINLGHLERRRRRWREADELYQRALGIRTVAVGERAPIVAQTIQERARLRLLEGRPAEALAESRRALDIREQAFGVEHHTVAESLADLAVAALLAGDEQLAAESAARAEEIGRRHYRLTARRLSEREGLGLSTQRVGGRDLLLTLAARAHRGPRVEQAFEAVVRSRNVVLEELAIRQEALHDASPALRASFSELQRESARLAQLMASGRPAGSNQNGDANNDDLEGGEIARARSLVDRLEREVAEGSETLRRSRGLASLSDVLAELPAGAVLVSLVRHQDFGAGPLSEGEGEGVEAPPAYLALIAGEQGVRAVSLGPAGTIDRAVARWRREVRAPAAGVEAPATGVGAPATGVSTGRSAEEDYRAAGAALRRVLWDPLERAVGAADRVLVVPDGDLHLVNLATLPAEDGRYLAESGPRFHTLVAETDLLRPALSGGGGLLALGAPDFESAGVGDAVTVAMDPDRGSGAAQPADGFAAVGGLRSWCPSLADTHFEAIPGTREEVQAVEALWRSSRERAGAAGDAASSLVLIGPAASESAVRSRSGGKRIVHLATHGFSLGSDCRIAASGVRGVGGLTPATGGRPGPTLSGLVLAGAHRALEAPGGSDDGLLTSLEIGGLDLRDTEWVVLSACDTGVGPTVAGEGVLAMHRAFLAAGARTVITSLWAVEDRAARRWMEHLYRSRLIEGRSTAEAVHAATLRSLAERRAREEPVHPFYWGAFVAIGDWR